MNKSNTDINYIRQYLNGELSSKEMHELERASHEDEMLMDIILGMEFELNNNLANNIDEIHQQILHRASQKIAPKNISWSPWAIAASILLALSFGAYYFLTPDPIAPENQLTSIEESSKRPAVENKKDSVLLFEEEKISKIELKKEPNKIIERIPTEITALEADTTTLMIVAAIPKLTLENPSLHQNRIGSYSSNKNMIEIIGAQEKPLSTNLNIAMVQSLEARNANANTQFKLNSDNVAQTRVKLNQMNLDPYASFVLNQAINNKDQQQQNQSLALEKTELKGQGENAADNYLASKKSTVTNNLHKQEGTKSNNSESIPLNNISIVKSYPTIGWTSYNNYIKKELNKIGVTTLSAKLSLTINSAQKADKIAILYTSNSLTDAALTKIIQSGSTWIVGEDKETIMLEIKF